MKFEIIEDEKKICCEIVLTFKDQNTNINYIVYREENSDKLYSSRYVIEDGNIILKNIENDYEWNLIDNMLEKSGE